MWIPLHPSMSLSLIHQMPRLFHTNINLLGDNICVASDGDNENPKSQVRLGLHAITDLVIVPRHHQEAINAAQSISIPTSIADCGNRMNMLTHLDILEVANITSFFRHLAAKRTVSGAIKLWPNLRVLKIWRCFADDRFVQSVADGVILQTQQDRHVKELLASIPQALGQIPHLEELLLEIRTPNLRPSPQNATRQLLDLALVRSPRLYPDTPHIYHHPPGAAVLYIRAENATEQEVVKQWKSAISIEWSKNLFGYQSNLTPRGYQWREPNSQEVVRWKDEDSESDETQDLALLADADSVYSDLPYTEPTSSDLGCFPDIGNDGAYAISRRFSRA
ncbi:hypothetical protein N0V93_008747 [Gnomoniopsis smithogilvyi]|uniref:Uncharacterized protein n=1 Tax=Gnomoniopsis smithogilvyi TaxID=1191159 RepID=A0A9W9CU71_9PEZI|nr:hypothetical protein N0V93_008747 [Gnomoniopsis smithogilvyi]